MKKETNKEVKKDVEKETNKEIEKTELDEKKIEAIQLRLARQADLWYMSGGTFHDGMEVFRTQDKEIFVLKDTETGVQLGMHLETPESYLTKISFFKLD